MAQVTAAQALREQWGIGWGFPWGTFRVHPESVARAVALARAGAVEVVLIGIATVWPKLAPTHAAQVTVRRTVEPWGFHWEPVRVVLLPRAHEPLLPE